MNTAFIKNCIIGLISVIGIFNTNNIMTNKTELANNIENIEVQDKQIVFYVQHQDDEILFAGSSIITAIKTVGKDNVHVVLVSDGSGTGVFKTERYTSLEKQEKSQLRTNEFNSSLETLGINMKNVIYLNQPEDNVILDSLKETVLNFENKYKCITHITHSYKYDVHPQHLATGNLIYNLYKDNQIKEVKFFTLAKYMGDINQDIVIENTVDNEEDRLKILNACHQYRVDNKDMVREGVGYKSVSSMFDILTSDEKAKSYLHLPQ